MSLITHQQSDKVLEPYSYFVIGYFKKKQETSQQWLNELKQHI